MNQMKKRKHDKVEQTDDYFEVKAVYKNQKIQSTFPLESNFVINDDKSIETFHGIKGLSYYRNFISDDEQKKLLNEIDQQEWSEVINRRVQHYGYRYDYKNKSIDSYYLGPLPEFVSYIVERMMSKNIFEIEPNQLIINGI